MLIEHFRAALIAGLVFLAWPAPVAAQSLTRDECGEIASKASPSRALEASRIALGLVDKFAGVKEAQARVLAASTYSADGATATLDLGAVASWEQVFYFYTYSGSDEYLEIKHFFKGKPVLRKASQYRSIVESQVPDARDRALLMAYVQRDFAQSTPWSAAFISSVMREAGFANNEFIRYIGHWRYIAEALVNNGVKDTSYKFRACNPVDVRPRVGDLVCNARKKAAASNYVVSSYDELVLYVRANGKDKAGYESHCDIVVKTNYDGRKPNIEVVGGNKGDTVKKVTLAVEEKNGDLIIKEAGGAPMIATLVAVE